MITRLHIRNFKAHSKLELPLSRLNILTGMNGTGKSSIIQALLLLRQSFQVNQLKGLELLNAPLCKLGTAADALYASAEEDEIVFSLTCADVACDFSFPVPATALSKTFLPVAGQPAAYLSDLSLFNADFQYISAYRNGPLDRFTSNTYLVEYGRQISDQEGRAELVAHFIDHYRQQEIPIGALCYPGTEDRTFHVQLDYWLKEFASNIHLRVEQEGDTGYNILYRFPRPGRPNPGEFKAKNVGFGISYDLPLLAAILMSKPGDLLLLENPEAHVHPAAQAKLVGLMALAAQAGVQFLVETHSDHIVNGMLVAVKEGRITPADVCLYYCHRDSESDAAQVSALEVKPGGRIGSPPSGFFDQIDIDMKRLLGF